MTDVFSHLATAILGQSFLLVGDSILMKVISFILCSKIMKAGKLIQQLNCRWAESTMGP